jgi:gas vesicle protein
MDNRISFLFIGILSGAVVGAAVALLVSPNNGLENRRLIKDFVNKGSGSLKDAPDKLRDVYAQVTESAKQAIR